jgi:hypothetical protein
MKQGKAMMRRSTLASLALVVGLLVMTGSALAEGTKICVPENASKPVLSASATNECPTKHAVKYKEATLPTGAQLEVLEQILPHVKYVESGVADKPTIQFSGVNVQVVNGEGKTGTTNGEGNLEIGYDENAAIEQTGSHNLIVGEDNAFTSFGGIVAGKDNSIRGPMASVLGGAENEALKEGASVVGGGQNIASANLATVSGGDFNEAKGPEDSILGGLQNTAKEKFASVSGGLGNTADAEASVSGGDDNVASGEASWIGAGIKNKAEGPLASIAGGEKNVATGEGSSISGGGTNTATGLDSSIFGGKELTASGEYEAIP